MKRKLSLLLVALMLLVLPVACSNKTATEEKEPETPVETTEEAVEETEEEAETETAAVEVGPIAKIGLGNFISTGRSADAGEKPAKAGADVTVAAVAFDADGKIVDVKIDVAQTAINFNEDNTDGVIDETVDFRTKMEKGPDYGMKKVSPIEKEYDEQIMAFEDYLVGKTAEEVVGIPTKEANDHPSVPDVAELASVTTIDIGTYQQVVKEAWDNAVDAKGATKLGLGITTDASNKAADGDKPAQIQINTYMSALGLDDSDMIVANYIDVVQAKVQVNADGTIVEKMEDVKTKKDLKEEYGMKDHSEIGKEWYEQMAAWEAFTVGKTVEEVQNIPVKEANPTHQHVPDLPELASSVTITVEGYQGVMAKAFENATK